MKEIAHENRDEKRKKHGEAANMLPILFFSIVTAAANTILYKKTLNNFKYNL